MTSTKRRLVLVHDGNISNRNQARALGTNLDVHFASVQEINLSSESDSFTPSSSSSSYVMIGCGKQASRFTCQYTGQSSSNVQTVQILHPRFPFQSSTSRFDCLVLPTHDVPHRWWFESPLDEAKLVRMTGSLGWNLDYFSLLRYRQRARSKLNSESSTSGEVLVVLMGKSLLHPRLLRELESSGSSTVEFITSRRTMQTPHATTNVNRLDYREALSVGDAFLVDADSISMVSDVLAVMSERNLPAPVYLFSSPPTAKHANFLKHMQASLFAPNITGGSLLFQRVHSLSDMMPTKPASTFSSLQQKHAIHFPNEARRVGGLVAKMLKLV